MRGSALKYIRIGISLLIFAIITFLFLDHAGAVPHSLSIVAKVQFLPALLSGSVIIVGLLLVATLIFGRIYCSSVCPMGVFQDIVSWLSRHLHVGKKKRKFYGYKKPRNILRYIVLAVTVLALVFGVAALPALIDPYSAYGRMATNLMRPVYIWINNLCAGVLGIEWFLKDDVVMQGIGAFVIAIVTLVVIVALAWVGGRTYCNTICPVGTVLGAVGRYSLLKVQIDHSKCNGCQLCGKKCKASCIDSPNKKIDYSRCVMCFDCLDNCRQKALHYSPSWKIDKSEQRSEKVDESRRNFLVTGLSLTVAAAAASSPLLAATTKQSQKRSRPIAPAGSQSFNHLNATCTGCNLCITKCPEKVLKPATMEYGMKGFLQPTLVYDNGYCDFECNACASVCPNGAIKPITLSEKQHISIGVAVYEPQKCIINTKDEKCGNCARRCPVDAIEMVASGNGIRQPHVIEDRCIGCGSCEYHCPADAIHVEGLEQHHIVKEKE